MNSHDSPGRDNAADHPKSGVSTHIDWGAVRGALARIDPQEAR
jgi:hypothetical protein